MLLQLIAQDLFCVKPVKIIDKDRTFAQPLAVELTLERLVPTGFGNGEVRAVPLTQIPVTGSYIVTQCVFVRMHSHLGITGGAGGEKTSQETFVLETSKTNPRYHSNCVLRHRFTLQQALSLNAGTRKHLATASALRLGSDGSCGTIQSARTNH